jgi:hypothetical protein
VRSIANPSIDCISAREGVATIRVRTTSAIRLQPVRATKTGLKAIEVKQQLPSLELLSRNAITRSISNHFLTADSFVHPHKPCNEMYKTPKLLIAAVTNGDRRSR